MKKLNRLFLILPKLVDLLLSKLLVCSFLSRGKNIRIFPLSSSFTYNTIKLGDDVFIGPGARFSALKGITIGSKVMFGPNVTIMAGDHNFKEIGKYMFDVEIKREEDDQPVVINDDVWIGANVTILKGVEIGVGSVIAAGSIVNKNLPEYSICAGIPCRKVRDRFSQFELKEHKSLIKNV